MTSSERRARLAASNEAHLREIAARGDGADSSAAVAILVAREIAARDATAAALAERLLTLPDEAALRRAATFTLRCEQSCRLAMIFARARMGAAGGPPTNELLIAWTQRGWRATLARWYLTDDGHDRRGALPVACRHGHGLFQAAEIATFVSHGAPDPASLWTRYSPGSSRRLSDRLDDDPAAERTVGSAALGESWLAR